MTLPKPTVYVFFFQISQIQRLMVYNCQLEDSGVYRAVVGKSECSASLKVSRSFMVTYFLS